MAHMFVDYFVKSPIMALPILALVLFITVFAVAAVRAWRRGQAAYEPWAKLPLSEDRHD